MKKINIIKNVQKDIKHHNNVIKKLRKSIVAVQVEKEHTKNLRLYATSIMTIATTFSSGVATKFAVDHTDKAIFGIGTAMFGVISMLCTSSFSKEIKSNSKKIKETRIKVNEQLPLMPALSKEEMRHYNSFYENANQGNGKNIPLSYDIEVDLKKELDSQLDEIQCSSGFSRQKQKH